MPSPRRAWIVVHGVGDPEPGHTLDQVLGTLAVDDLVHEERVLVADERLQGEIRPGYRRPHFGRVRRVRWQGDAGETSEELFAEVYWGDIAGVQQGPIGLLAALRDLLLGFPQLVQAAIRAPRTAVRSEIRWRAAVGGLSATVGHLLSAPIVALNLFFLLGYVTIGVSQKLYRGPTAASWTMLALSLAVASGAFAMLRSRRMDPFRARWRLSRAALGALLALALCVAATAGSVLWRGSTADHPFGRVVQMVLGGSIAATGTLSIEQTVQEDYVELTLRGPVEPATRDRLRSALITAAKIRPIVVLDLRRLAPSLAEPYETLGAASEWVESSDATLVVTGKPETFGIELARRTQRPLFFVEPLLARAAASELARSNRRQDPPGMPPYTWYAALLIAAMQLTWMLMIVVALSLWVAWLIGRYRVPRDGRPSLDAAALLTLIMVGFWTLAIPTAWQMVFSYTPAFLDVAALQPLFYVATPMIGVQWILAGVMLVAAGLGVVAFRRGRQHDPRARLIVHDVILFAVPVTSLLGMGGLTLLVIAPTSHDWMTAGNSIGVAVSIVASTAVLMLAGPLRVVVDIVLDVMRQFDPPAGGEPARRERIVQRFQTILRAVMRQRPERVDIV
ncbi:MAG: hypothetical protein KDC87_18050, partial [Planctomycetes bacterium]|nr:hypothetical protein [Planctomycetota bacterium]